MVIYGYISYISYIHIFIFIFNYFLNVIFFLELNIKGTFIYKIPFILYHFILFFFFFFFFLALEKNKTNLNLLILYINLINECLEI